MLELYTNYDHLPADVYDFGCKADGEARNLEESPRQSAWEDVNYVLIRRPDSTTSELDMEFAVSSLSRFSEPYRYDMPDGTIFYVLQH